MDTWRPFWKAKKPPKAGELSRRCAYQWALWRNRIGYTRNTARRLKRMTYPALCEWLRCVLFVINTAFIGVDWVL
jgi:hypothetical protein